MKKFFLFVCCLAVWAVSVSAQTVTFDPETWYLEGGKMGPDGTGKLNAASSSHHWVSSCDIDSRAGDINALGPENMPIGYDYGMHYYKRSNIGTPLQLILNGSASYNNRTEQPCADSRRIQIARRFLQMGADPNDGLYHQVGNNSDEMDSSKNKFFKIDTPLGYAARSGRLDIAELLLQNGADPNYTWNGFWQKTSNGAYWDNNAHFALEQVITSSVKGYSPAQRNQMIDLLVRRGADVNAVDDCGNTPVARLMRCAVVGGGLCPRGFNQRDYLNVARHLRSKGANVKVKGQVQASCRGNSFAGASARDIWKEMSAESRDLWAELF